MVYATRATPGFVPVTLIDIATETSPLITLPELGEVKQIVMLYAPEVGVLVAHGLTGTGVAVGVGEGIGVAVGVGVAVAVGFGVFVGFGV